MTRNPHLSEDAIRRAHRACEPLDHGSASVSDVAFDCGYADTSHFISVFKREFGVTPREYACQKLKKENR